MQFGIRLAAIRCLRPYGSRQYHRRETFQKNLASVHKKSVSEAATATDVFSRFYCCSLEPFLQRYGAPGLTGLANTIGAKRSTKKLASVHKKSESEAATATGVTSRSYCCSLESVLQRCGASGLTGLDTCNDQRVASTLRRA